MSSTCQDCYQVSTPNPCDKIGCLDTTYGKCVKYSGNPLFCGRGPIGNFTVSGTPGAAGTTIDVTGQETRGGIRTFTVTGTATGLTSNGTFGPFYPSSTNGSGAGFYVVISGGSVNNVSGVTKFLSGSEYNVGDVLTLSGTLLPGGTSSDNLTITVNTVSKLGKFSVTRINGNANYQVTVTDRSNNYVVGESILIKGSQVGGSDGANDLTITVTSIQPQINTLDNLDVVIQNINSRLCSLFGSFSDYSAFNFSCLKLGGALTTGSSIQNEQQFVESASAAICAIDTRVLALEKPAMTVPACLSLTSGTSTLSQILTEIGSKLCSSYNQSAVITGITTPAACFADFTAQPGSGTATATQWIQWILTNICTIKTALRTDIDALDTNVTNINNLLGTTYTLFNNSAAPFSSGGHGGTTNQNMYATVGVLKNVLSTYHGYFTAMGANLRANSFAVSAWGGCFSGIGASTSAQTIETQLGWVVNALKSMNPTYNGSHFQVSATACGLNINLHPSAIFSPGMLSAADLDDLGDVIITSPTDPSVLYWNGTAWVDTPIDSIVQIVSSDATINVTKTVAPGSVTYNVKVPALAPTAYALSPASLLGATNVGSIEFPVSGASYLRVIKQGNFCMFEGSALIVSTGTFTVTANIDFTLASAIPAAIRPARQQYVGFSIIRRTGSPIAPANVYYGVATIFPAGDLKLRFIQPVGTSTTFASLDELEIMLGGLTYSLL